MDKYNEAVNRYLQRTGFDFVDPKMALIDMDGTLYDSMPYHAHAWKLLTDELGFDIPEEQFFKYEGMTGEATLAMLFRNHNRAIPPADEIKRMYQRKTFFFNRDGKAEIMPGARKMVWTLDRYGIGRTLVTGSGQRSIIDKVCSDFDCLFRQDAMVTSHDVKNGKPHPEPYLKGMAMAERQPWECIVIENAPLGIMSGSRAGAFTIGVCTGPIPEVEMADAGADIIFGSMPRFAEELPALIQCFRNSMSIQASQYI